MTTKWTSDAETLVRTVWDAVIVGTGMGGGTCGYALAKAGWRVLFVEKGISHRGPGARPISGFPEDYFAGQSKTSDPENLELLKRAGRCFTSVIDRTGGRERSFIPIIGAGLGGSSTIYGAILERFFPEDFKSTPHFSGAEGASVVDWPMEYKDLEEYYQRAESLYEVYGKPDPLRTEFQPTTLAFHPLSAVGQEFFGHLQKKGLHPYQVPCGHKDHVRCPGCTATICLPGEKSGSGEKCVIPALELHGAGLLDGCDAVELLTDSTKVTGLRVVWNGQTHILKASTFILGAGAIWTPQLLLRSRSHEWPQGVGNHSDQVGRNYMRHYMDLHIVLPSWTKKVPPPRVKELGFNDFYLYEGTKLGTVQTIGNYPSIRATLLEMEAEHRADHPFLSPLYFPLYSMIMQMGMRFFLPRTLAFSTIMDDVPYAHNRITITDDSSATVVFEYSLSAYERKRIKLLRKLVSDSFRPHFSLLRKQAENNQRMAHACGTCRMGADPGSSVVDPWNKVHGVDNLYVVDASVFPTGSGINPSLTIAALALRAAANMSL